MKIVVPGHVYILRHLDSDEYTTQLAYVSRTGAAYPGNDKAWDGPTSQEVLRSTIDRTNWVYNQLPNWETWIAYRLLKAVVWLFELRAARRKRRHWPTMDEAINGPFCAHCGHADGRGNNHGNWCKLKTDYEPTDIQATIR